MRIGSLLTYMPNNPPQVAEYGVTQAVQITTAAKEAGFAELTLVDGEYEEQYRTTNVQQVKLASDDEDDDRVLVLLYDLEQVEYFDAAQHVRDLAAFMGLPTLDIPVKSIRPHRRGNGYCVPLGIADEWEPGTELGVSATDGFIAINNREEDTLSADWGEPTATEAASVATRAMVEYGHRETWGALDEYVEGAREKIRQAESRAEP